MRSPALRDEGCVVNKRADVAAVPWVSRQQELWEAELQRELEQQRAEKRRAVAFLLYQRYTFCHRIVTRRKECMPPVLHQALHSSPLTIQETTTTAKSSHKHAGEVFTAIVRSESGAANMNQLFSFDFLALFAGVQQHNSRRLRTVTCTATGRQFERHQRCTACILAPFISASSASAILTPACCAATTGAARPPLMSAASRGDFSNPDEPLSKPFFSVAIVIDFFHLGAAFRPPAASCGWPPAGGAPWAFVLGCVRCQSLPLVGAGGSWLLAACGCAVHCSSSRHCCDAAARCIAVVGGGG